MSESGLSKDIDFDGRGFAKDVEFGKDKQNKNSKSSSNDDECGTITGFISKMQEISVQESLITGNIDKNLFTLQKTLCALKNGFKLGFGTAITILLHIIFCFVFSFEFIINFFERNETVFLILKYFPAIITIIISIFIANLSRYAVGDFTAKGIKTFFLGKFIATIISGFLIILVFSYINSFLAGIHINQMFENAKYIFNQNISTLYFQIVFLILLSSLLPFLFYGFRSLFFNSNSEDDYNKY